MKRLALAMMVLLAAVMLTSAPAWTKNPENAFVNFGVPGTSGALNHMIVPNDVTISSGGIVNFAIVSGVGPGASALGRRAGPDFIRSPSIGWPTAPSYPSLQRRSHHQPIASSTRTVRSSCR